jgi:hypothetical protein
MRRSTPHAKAGRSGTTQPSLCHKFSHALRAPHGAAIWVTLIQMAITPKSTTAVVRCYRRVSISTWPALQLFQFRLKFGAFLSGSFRHSLTKRLVVRPTGPRSLDFVGLLVPLRNPFSRARDPSLDFQDHINLELNDFLPSSSAVHKCNSPPLEMYPLLWPFLSTTNKLYTCEGTSP